MRKKGSIFMGLGLLLIFACQPKSDYEILRETELAKGVTYDSLFAGLSLDMTKKEFFDHCWEMNRQGVFMNGTGSQVLYDASPHFSRPTNLTFYPKYIEGEMLEMPLELIYQDWAIWNEETTVELLIDEIKEVLLEWYGGNDFIEIVNEDETVTIWVKIDGNRQIRVGRKSISTALVTITNLNVAEKVGSNQKS